MAIQQKGPRLGDYFLGHRRTKTTFLDEINELINWQPINAFLCKKIRRKANAVGNPAYPPLTMFKILLLQRWYNLSDPGVEQALLDRHVVLDGKPGKSDEKSVSRTSPLNLVQCERTLFLTPQWEAKANPKENIPGLLFPNSIESNRQFRRFEKEVESLRPAVFSPMGHFDSIGNPL